MRTSSLSPHQRFLLAYKRTHRCILCCRLLLLFAFLIFWEVMSRSHFIDAYIFSSPSRIFSCFLSMEQDASLFLHIQVTLQETFYSFLLVMLLTLFFALLFFLFPVLFQVLEPAFVILNSLPKSALAPLLIVWLGTGMTTIVVTGISVALFGSILNLTLRFQQTDPQKIRLIRSLGGNRLDLLFHLILPSSLPEIFGLMKVNIGLCLVGVIIGEFISSKCGLGYLIIYGSQVFKLDYVILSILLLCLFSILLYEAICLSERAIHHLLGK